jgi:hypothetical protein
MDLEPGDVILTGAPPGVGLIQPGDVVDVAVKGLGALSLPVVAEEPATLDDDRGRTRRVAGPCRYASTRTCSRAHDPGSR